MGYTTDFIGHIDIEPHLNASEIAYLEAFRHARHFDCGGSPYDVPGNPLAPDHLGVDAERYNVPAPDKPQLYCQWAVCGSGCCLAFDGNEKFYQPVEWLRYLIDHLLKPAIRRSWTSPRSTTRRQSIVIEKRAAAVDETRRPPRLAKTALSSTC